MRSSSGLPGAGRKDARQTGRRKEANRRADGLKGWHRSGTLRETQCWLEKEKGEEEEAERAVAAVSKGSGDAFCPKGSGRTKALHGCIFAGD